MDRYRGGECTGDYLSRLHYLEDWLYDNNRRGLVEDLTRDLGWTQRSAFRTGDDRGLATLSLSRCELVRFSGHLPHGKQTFHLASVRNSKKPSRSDRTESCAVVTSSGLFRATAVDFVRTLTWAGARTSDGVCISCMFFAQ
jgi:hypothetical protein